MMKPKTDSRSKAGWRAAAAATLAVLALGLGACANPPTEVDPGFFPEGQTSTDARLVTWFDQPNVVKVYDDLLPVGPDPIGDLCGLPIKGFEDTLLGTSEEYTIGAGAIRGVIVDGTPAGGYQVFRREMNGGYWQYEDFLADRFRQWLETGWEAYRFDDRTPSGLTPASYLGRGVVDGKVTAQSPLTNATQLSLVSTPVITVTSTVIPRDSLFVITWQPVTSAVGYWLQVYETPPIPPQVAILRGAPAPFFDGSAKEVFTGFVHAPSTTYKIGDTSRTDVDIFYRNTTFFSRIYIARISAVDATGQMIATTRGPNGMMVAEGSYALFPLGGVAFCPTPPRGAAEGVGGGPEGVPRLDLEGRVVWRVSHLSYVPK